MFLGAFGGFTHLVSCSGQVISHGVKGWPGSRSWCCIVNKFDRVFTLLTSSNAVHERLTKAPKCDITWGTEVVSLSLQSFVIWVAKG